MEIALSKGYNGYLNMPWGTLGKIEIMNLVNLLYFITFNFVLERSNMPLQITKANGHKVNWSVMKWDIMMLLSKTNKNITLRINKGYTWYNAKGFNVGK